MIKIGGLIVSKGSEFLPEVLGLIEKRLGEIDKNIQAVRQDINSMNITGTITRKWTSMDMRTMTTSRR